MVTISQCTLWTGATTRGYGVRNTSGKVRYVHRMVCEAVHGPPPFKGALALHHCNQPLCYNGDHLYWGDHKQNARDAIRDGFDPSKCNQPKGEKHPLSVLTLNQVRDIRRRYKPRIVTLQMLADEYEVHFTTISAIVRGRNWREEHGNHQ